MPFLFHVHLCLIYFQFQIPQNKKMGNSPTTLQPGLYVHFYGAHSFKTESLFIPPSKFPVTYEQVCIEASKHLCKELAKFYEQNTDKTIGPLFLPIFGLYGADHSQQRWVSQAHIFKDSGNVEEFYFRVKVRMAKNRQPARIVTEYYYLQVSGGVWYFIFYACLFINVCVCVY